MVSSGGSCHSGDWVVLDNKEEEFLAAWEEFARWSVDTFADLNSATLMRQNDSPRHFISIGVWDDAESLRQWRQHPEFVNKLGAARAFCSSFHVLDYTVAVTVS